jgi:hypothetical protein
MPGGGVSGWRPQTRNPFIVRNLPFAESNRFSLACLVFFVFTKKLIHKTQSKKEKQ